MYARLCLPCLLALWMGCGRPPGPAASATSARGEVSPGTADAASSNDAAATAAALNDLTQAVRKFAAEQRRVPKGLEEVLAAGYLSSIPPAPAGKKFAINKNLLVYLANQ